MSATHDGKTRATLSGERSTQRSRMPSNFQQRTPRRRFLPVPTFQTLVFHKTKKGYREFPASGPRPFYRAAWSAATSGLPAELGREPKQPVLGQLARWQRCSVSNKRPRRRFVLGTKMRRRLTGLAWPVRPAEQANGASDHCRSRNESRSAYEIRPPIALARCPTRTLPAASTGLTSQEAGCRNNA